jgi:hypothetical protein
MVPSLFFTNNTFDDHGEVIGSINFASNIVMNISIYFRNLRIWLSAQWLPHW